MQILPLQFTHNASSFSCNLRTTADSRTMPMEPLAFMPLLFKWRTSSLDHPQWQWAVYQFSSLFKFKRLPSHLVWLIQHLWEPLLPMDPALLLETLTRNRSLPGVEEKVHRESQASCLHSHIAIPPLKPLIVIWLHAQRINIGRGRKSNRTGEEIQMQNSYFLVCTHACVIALIVGEKPWWA